MSIAVRSNGNVWMRSGGGVWAVAVGPNTYTPTLWVDAATGDDSRSKATVAASGGSLPWQTIGRAVWGNASRSSPNTAEAADAGDVVAVEAGTYAYSGTVSSRQTPVYNCANDGTLSDPIAFIPVGNVRLSAVSANSPIIGSDDKDYIFWVSNGRSVGKWLITCDGRVPVDNVDSDDTKSGDVVNTKPDTGPVVLWNNVGCRIECCDIDGGPAINYEDNWNGFRTNNATDFVFRNNDVTGFNKASGSNHNYSCITLYGASNGLIEHNNFSSSGCGVFFKDQSGTNFQSDNIVRFNRISGCIEAIAFSLTSEGRNYIYQNLALNCEQGLSVTGGGPSSDWYFNNTFYNCTAAVVYLANGSGSGGQFWNNIIHTSPLGIAVNGVTMPADTVFDSEHNCWYSVTTFYNGSDGNKNFADFKTAYTDQEAASPASITSDPLFTNLAGGDYTLQVGSPARNLAADLGGFSSLIHAGCYQTGSEVIGVET